MSAVAQELAAYAAVIIATAWLGLRWHRRRAQPGCHGCASAAPQVRGRLHLPVVNPSPPSRGY